MNPNHQKLYEAINEARNKIKAARSEADTVELLPDELCNGLNQLQLFIDFAMVEIMEGRNTAVGRKYSSKTEKATSIKN